MSKKEKSVCFLDFIFKKKLDPPKRKQGNIDIFCKIRPYRYSPGLIKQNFENTSYTSDCKFF